MPVYPNALNQMGQAGINLLTDPIYAVLLSSGYTYSSAHTVRSATGWTGAEIGTPTQLTTPSLTSGVFDADDVTYNAVTGTAITQIGIFKRVGADLTTPGDDPLIALIPVTSLTPNGGNITVAWDNGTNKIFAI